MKLVVFALDYDGTLSSDGGLGPEVQQALALAHERGLLNILVTGRRLADLAKQLAHFDAFDAIVGENGAVLHFPRTGRSTLLANPPDPEFLQELARRGVGFTAGECVVELDAQHAPAVLEAIRALELPLILVFNRGRLMVLPQAVSKGTGLREAARALRVSLHNAAAVGDAENDHDLLRACEHGVAVGWGSHALARTADEVLPGDGPAAVAAWIRRSCEAGRLPRVRPGRGCLQIGTRSDGSALALAVLGRNVLIAGDAQSGKSWLAGLLAEQLVLHKYCVCLIDPEGDYTTLEALPGVMVMSPLDGALEFDALERALRFPDVSVVVDLSQLSAECKRAYVPALLRRVNALRRRSGLPHRIVLDEAHYFLRGPEAESLVDRDAPGYTFVSFRVSELHPTVLDSNTVVLVARESDPEVAEALRLRFGRGWSAQDWARLLASLELDEAALLPGAVESGRELLRFRVARRLTPHVRHQHKYLEAPVSRDLAFLFRRHGRETGRRAESLQELIAVLAAAPEQVYSGHLEGGDFSRWIEQVFHDTTLAEEVRRIEREWRANELVRPHDRIVRAIQERYAGFSRAPIAPGVELPAAPVGLLGTAPRCADSTASRTTLGA